MSTEEKHPPSNEIRNIAVHMGEFRYNDLLFRAAVVSRGHYQYVEVFIITDPGIPDEGMEPVGTARLDPLVVKASGCLVCSHNFDCCVCDSGVPNLCQDGTRIRTDLSPFERVPAESMWGSAEMTNPRESVMARHGGLRTVLRSVARREMADGTLCWCPVWDTSHMPECVAARTEIDRL